MAEQRITTKPTVNALLDEDYIFINHDGALRQVRKSDADLASAEGLAAEATARQQFMTDETQARQAFEENLTEANEEFVETVDERMNAAESIVYGAFPIGTVSGSIASFNDGADDVPMKSVKVAIVPKQSGSGDPSPSNVRPITGTSTANVFVTGANVWDEEWESGDINVSNGAKRANSTRIRSKNFIPVSPNATYYCNSSTYANMTICFYDANQNWVSSDANVGYVGAINTVFTTPSWCHYIYFYCNGTTYNNGISINYPSTDHSYHPYAGGHTTPVPLGQTVYGGELDVTTGVLTIDRAMVDLATLTWSQMSGYIQTSGVASVIKPPATQSTMCDVIAEQYVASTWAGTATNGIGINGNGIMAIDDVTSANGKMVYTLRTPQTVQLTPAEVRTLLGDNNVWSDAGDVTAEYRKDPTIALANLEALILENI